MYIKWQNNIRAFYFMCHNRKGRSVVDYILTEHKNVNKCIKCKVYNMTIILSEHVKILNTISSSFLNSVSEKIYSFENVNENFMNNDIWTRAMHEIIESLETRMHVNETHKVFCVTEK